METKEKDDIKKILKECKSITKKLNQLHKSDEIITTLLDNGTEIPKSFLESSFMKSFYDCDLGKAFAEAEAKAKGVKKNGI